MINEDFPFNSLRGNIEKHNPIEVCAVLEKSSYDKSLF